MRLRLLVFVVTSAILTLLVFQEYFFMKSDKSRWGEAVHNGVAIQLALERYASDHGDAYPLTFDSLVEQGYLLGLHNPYSRREPADVGDTLSSEDREALSEMQPLGSNSLPIELQTHLLWPGNFCYLPRMIQDSKGGWEVPSYSLLVFGRRRWCPGWWETARTIPIVVSYYSSETDERQTWR